MLAEAKDNVRVKCNNCSKKKAIDVLVDLQYVRKKQLMIFK